MYDPEGKMPEKHILIAVFYGFVISISLNYLGFSKVKSAKDSTLALHQMAHMV